MKVVDILWGKFIGHGLYHLSCDYLKRVTIEESEEFNAKLVEVATSSIEDILVNGSVDDNIRVLLGMVKDNLDSTSMDEGKAALVNDAIGMLNYNKYQFAVVIRSDIDEFNDVIDADRSYVLNTDMSPINVRNITYGMSVMFSEPSMSNTTSMIMEFVLADKLSLGSQEIESLSDISAKLEEYRMLSERDESYMMDCTDLLNFFESRDTKFFLALSPTVIEG